MQGGFLAGALSLMMAAVPGTALADDAACMARFKELAGGSNPKSGPVRILNVQEFGGTKTENYFHSQGDDSGDGMMEPLKNMGDMWVLFRAKKMYMSTDKGRTWKFGRNMDDASQPEAYKEQVRKDLETADKVKCSTEEIDGAAHEVVEGEYKSTALQGAMSFNKYWVRQDNGFLSRYETSSEGAGGKFHSLQIIEPAPDLKLPDPE